MATSRTFLADDSATIAFGEELADTLAAGDTILLFGDLGAGKSALARAIIRRLLRDPAADVPSPTFSIVQPYETADHLILHADLYRLSDQGEIDELGLFDDAAAIRFIEWPDRAPRLRSLATHRITLEVPDDGQGRWITLERL